MTNPQRSETMSERFKKGDRVVAAERAYRNGLWDRRNGIVRGTVATDSRKPGFVTVVLDGQSTPSSYHAAFWVPDTGGTGDR
jgi:hypothetical protein